MKIALLLALSLIGGMLTAQVRKLATIKNADIHFQTYTGGVYVGEINDRGRPEGTGCINFGDSIWFVGHFQNGEAEGAGVKLRINQSAFVFENIRHGETTGQFIWSNGKSYYLYQHEDSADYVLRTSTLTDKYLINTMYEAAKKHTAKTSSILSLENDNDISLMYGPSTDDRGDFDGNIAVYQSASNQIDIQQVSHGVFKGYYQENGGNLQYSLLTNSHITKDFERITGGTLPLWLQDGIYLYRNDNNKKFFARGALISPPGIFSMQYGALANDAGYSKFSRINPDLNPFGFMQQAFITYKKSYTFWLGDFEIDAADLHSGNGFAAYGDPTSTNFFASFGELRESPGGLRSDSLFLYNGIAVEHLDGRFVVTIGGWKKGDAKGSGYSLDTEAHTFFRGDLAIITGSGYGDLMKLTDGEYRLTEYHDNGNWHFEPEVPYVPVAIDFDTGTD